MLRSHFSKCQLCFSGRGRRGWCHATPSTTPTTLTIGGDLPVHRLGFGAMRLDRAAPRTGPTGVAIARRAVELGVTLHRHRRLLRPRAQRGTARRGAAPVPPTASSIAHQGRPGATSADEWIPLGRPEYLRQQAELSLRRLRVERIDLYQLHRVDPLVPLADQIGALRRLQDEGKVRHVGLSEVTVDAARARPTAITPIVSVQNRYNLADRASEDVLEYCERRGIAFLPWLPVAPTSARAAAPGRRSPRSPPGSAPPATQVALAWLLHRSPVMLPIPGTSLAGAPGGERRRRRARLDPDRRRRPGAADRLSRTA